jgi:inward rectifier potassium channel
MTKTTPKPEERKRYTTHVIGARATPFRDVYHVYLRMPWWRAVVSIVMMYLLLNALFAFVFVAIGGIANAQPGSFSDAFFFSIQTMGTIGYGSMYPTTMAANCAVVAESVTGLVVTAVATGLVFAKFSQSSARIIFSDRAAIGPMNGIPTLSIRIGNERSNTVIETQIRVVMTKTERTKEGHTFYRMLDLKLVRERSPALSRSWTVLHQIDASSPLFGHTQQTIKAEEMELSVTVFGVDDTSLQPVHAQKRYFDDEVLFGMRHADVLSEDADGNLVLDLRNFHTLEPVS